MQRAKQGRVSHSAVCNLWTGGSYIANSFRLSGEVEEAQLGIDEVVVGDLGEK